MATLISAIDISLSKKFKKNGSTDDLKVFNFIAGKQLKDIPDEYAKALVATYPERFFTSEDWKDRKGILVEKKKEVNKIAKGSEEDEKEPPTLEELKATDFGELKAIADNLSIRYGRTISRNTLALRVFEFIESTTKQKSIPDESK